MKLRIFHGKEKLLREDVSVHRTNLSTQSTELEAFIRQKDGYKVTVKIIKT